MPPEVLMGDDLWLEYVRRFLVRSYRPELALSEYSFSETFTGTPPSLSRDPVVWAASFTASGVEVSRSAAANLDLRIVASYRAAKLNGACFFRDREDRRFAKALVAKYFPGEIEIHGIGARDPHIRGILEDLHNALALRAPIPEYLSFDEAAEVEATRTANWR